MIKPHPSMFKLSVFKNYLYLMYHSVSYMLIMHFMRNQKTTYVDKYIAKLFHETISNGISAKELKKKYKILYRGVTPEFTLKSNIQEYGFISTTPNIEIAKKYADVDGKILVFLTKNLCNHCKYLLIDEQIFFLPGSLTINKLYSNHYLEYNYVSNHDIINKYIYQDFIIPTISCDTSNYIIIVWYRAIKNNKIEILADQFYKNEDTLKYDPLKYNFDDLISFIAFYDYRIQKFNTLHYGIYEDIYQILFDQSRIQEVKDLIVNTYNFTISDSNYDSDSDSENFVQ